MPITDQLRTAMTDWIVDLQEQQRSPDTIATYQSALNQFSHWLEQQPDDHDFSTLRINTFTTYIDDLRKRALHRHTILAYIGVLTRWLQDLVDQGIITTGIPNHRGRLITPAGVRDLLERAVGPRAPAVAPRIPDLRELPNYYPDQLHLFLQQRNGLAPTPADPRAFREYLSLLRNQALVGMLFSTGGRINEVLSLDSRQIQERGNIVHAVRVTGKGRKQRPLRLDDDTRQWIKEYLEERHVWFATVPALFISHGPRGAGKRLSDVSGWRIVKTAADALADQRAVEGASEMEVRDLRAVSPHSIRHYVAQAMLDEGADYKDIAAILGHSSSLVTETVYARLDDERMLEIADTFAPRRTRRARLSSSDEEAV